MSARCRWRRTRPGDAEAVCWVASVVGLPPNGSRLSLPAKRPDVGGSGSWLDRRDLLQAGGWVQLVCSCTQSPSHKRERSRRSVSVRLDVPSDLHSPGESSSRSSTQGWNVQVGSKWAAASFRIRLTKFSFTTLVHLPMGERSGRFPGRRVWQYSDSHPCIDTQMPCVPLPYPS